MWLGIPLVIGSLLILANGGSGGPRPQAHLLVADEDDNSLAGCSWARWARAAPATSSGPNVWTNRPGASVSTAARPGAVGHPQGLLGSGSQGRTDATALGHQSRERILPGIVEEFLRILADGAFYVHRLLGPELRAMAKGPSGGARPFPTSKSRCRPPPSIRPCAGWSDTSFRRRLSQDQGRQGPVGRYGAQLLVALLLLPGILVMGLLFAAQGLSGDVRQERESGVLRRVVTTPLGIPRFLVGELLAMVAVLAAIALVVLAAGMGYVGLPWSRLPLALAWSVAVGTMLTAMMLVLQVIASSRRGALLLTFALLMPLMMVGGCMFPLEAMPRWMAAVGRHTPNGWGIEQLKAILLGRDGPLGLPASFALMAAGATVLLVVAEVRMNRAFARR